MNVQPPICSLKFEIRDSVVELDIDEAFSYGLVDFCVLVALELGIEKVHFEGIIWSASIVQRDRHSPPMRFLLTERNKELLSFGFVAKVHREVQDPDTLELLVDQSIVLRGSHRCGIIKRGCIVLWQPDGAAIRYCDLTYTVQHLLFHCTPCHRRGRHCGAEHVISGEFWSTTSRVG